MCFGARFRDIDKIIEKGKKMVKKMITAYPANPSKREG